MPESSRHKSSRHSFREAREYSDSVKDRIGREDGGSGRNERHLKDSTSGEKRKLESKSVIVRKEPGDAESQKWKEKMGYDRWTGGDSETEHELLKREIIKGNRKEEEKGSSESRRLSRREDGGFDLEEGKRSGSKVESKHHRSERSEKEGGFQRESKGSRSEKSDNVGCEGHMKQGGFAEELIGKHGGGNTDSNIKEELRNLEPVRDADRRVRRKRDDFVDGDRHLGGVRDPEDRRQSPRDENAKYGKNKDDGHKNDRNIGRFQVDIDEMQRDNLPKRNCNGDARSDDKYSRSEKKKWDVSQKKLKFHISEYDRELDRVNKDGDRDRDYDRDGGRDCSRHDPYRDGEIYVHEYEADHNRERDIDFVKNRDCKDCYLERDRGHSLDRSQRDHDRDRVHDGENKGGRYRDLDHDHDCTSHIVEKGSRYRDDRGRRRTPDFYDGYHGDNVKIVDYEVDNDRSLSHKPNVDGVVSSSRCRSSPASRVCGVADKYRDGIQGETKYVDAVRDSPLSEAGDKVPKYRPGEKRFKFDENHIGGFSERSSSTKASPAGSKERSPSSRFDRCRFSGKSSRRGSLEVDEAERRSVGSNDLRDISAAEDRQSRDFSAKKSMGGEYLSSDLSMYHKPGRGSVSSHGPSPGPPVIRTGADRPFIGSFGEDSRGHSGSRYKRSADSNNGRAPGNAWNGAPNWPTPLPNGFMPFPPGPLVLHHGGFPPILSEFPPFGVRPLDMNHTGFPFHMAHGDRFPGHVRPIVSPNMIDGSVPPHFHGWDGVHGILRDEPGMFGPGHLGTVQRRDINADFWQQNGGTNADIMSGIQKDGHTNQASADKAFSGQGASRLENSGLEDQATSLKKDTLSIPSPMKETPKSLAKTPESSSVDGSAQSLRHYLVKLDVSLDLAVPDLYKQFIVLVKGQPENIEDLELQYTGETATMIPDISYVAVDAKLFPAAQDSLFQRAMDLYKEHSAERKGSVGLEGDKLCPSPAQPKLEWTALLDKKVGSPAGSIKQEERTLTGPEERVPLPREEDSEELVCTGIETPNNGPLQSSRLAPGVGDEGELPVLDVEKMEEDGTEELTSEIVDTPTIPIESIVSDTTGSITDKDIITGSNMTQSHDSAPGEQSVSSPSIFSLDSVKVCQPLISVSNKESVMLNRIHHTPGNTH